MYTFVIYRWPVEGSRDFEINPEQTSYLTDKEQYREGILPTVNMLEVG